MKFAIIKERKNPPDRRVVFGPKIAKKALNSYPDMEIFIESSDIRCFDDQMYVKAGLQVTDEVSHCDVFVGVKEVPIDALIPNKKYFFFSHTIKKQDYNRKLLRAILDKKIEFYDHETITAQNNVRLIGFGYFAGVVGAYNGIRTYGLKEGIFQLPAVETLKDKVSLIDELHNITLPPIKIVLTGNGRVGNAAKEILDAMYLRKVSVNEFLENQYDEPVYVQLDALDYNKRKDGERKDINDFFTNPEQYETDFVRFTKVANLFIAGHFHNDKAPDFFSNKDMLDPEFSLQVVADISCDIGHPIPSTIRSSTIADPIYGYNPLSRQEGDYKDPKNIAIMAVDNLPTSLPVDASKGFGEMFLEHVIPAFFNGDKNGVLKRAKMTENGKLTERFAYLQKYVDGLE